MYGSFTLPPQVQTEVSVCGRCSAMVLDPALHDAGAHGLGAQPEPVADVWAEQSPGRVL